MGDPCCYLTCGTVAMEALSARSGTLLLLQAVVGELLGSFLSSSGRDLGQAGRS